MKFRIPVLFTALAILAGCATGPEIRTDYDPTVDFGAFATYGFIARPDRANAEGYSTITERRIEAAITRALEARGYRKSEEPDLMVNFAVSAEDIQEVRQVPSATPPVGYYGWRHPYYAPWPAYTYETRVDNYRRGTLFIDLVDARENKLVWEGIATARITEKMRKEPEAAIDSVVAEVFARYPFQAGGN
jgi:hypothetical protein